MTAKPRKSGRSLTDAERKRPRVTYTLDPLAIETVKACAEAAGLPPSRWLEAAIYAYATRDEK
jgi:hypothetical protein